MTIVLSHGQPKSGSTFLFTVACALAERVNGQPDEEFRSNFPGGAPPQFVPKPDAELLEDLGRRLPAGGMLVLKTHRVWSDDLRVLIETGRIKATTSFRDPRDAALSMLETARRDRALGEDRWFAQFERLDELQKPIAFQFRDVQSWAALGGICAIPYHLIATDIPAVVGLLADHLDLGQHAAEVADEMARKASTIPEFNKGIADRFVDDLSEEDLRFAVETWKTEAEIYDEMLRASLRRLSRSDLAEAIIARRDAAIARRLGTGQS